MNPFIDQRIHNEKELINFIDSEEDAKKQFLIISDKKSIDRKNREKCFQ